MTWFDEYNKALLLTNYLDAVDLTIYYVEEDNMEIEFTFKNKEELEEFVKELNRLKEITWP